MPEVVNCPQCERKLRVPEDLLGKKVKCPTCGNTFTAEVPSAAPPPRGEEDEHAPPRQQYDDAGDEEYREGLPRLKKPGSRLRVTVMSPCSLQPA